MKPLAAAASAFLLLAGVASAAPGDDMYARPGKLVAASGTRLNLYCMGSGSPAVVFDSGWEDWAPVWTIVQPEVAKLTRACSYDRAGAGFSDAGAMPRTSVRVVCTFGVTIETLVPTSALSSVDLPAFGAPISATKPQCVVGSVLGSPVSAIAARRLDALALHHRRGGGLLGGAF